MNRNRRLTSRIAKVLIANSNRLHGPAIYRALLRRPAGTYRLTRDAWPHLTGVIWIRLIRSRTVRRRLRRLIRRSAVLRLRGSLNLSAKPRLGQTQRIAFAAEYVGRWLIESMATDWAAPRLVRWYNVE